LPVSPHQLFYPKLNATVDEAGLEQFAEAECQQFYATVMGPAGSSSAVPSLTRVMTQSSREANGEQ
jgi:hypothetical protein